MTDRTGAPGPRLPDASGGGGSGGAPQLPDFAGGAALGHDQQVADLETMIESLRVH